jgi:hypothetical protein
MNYSRDMSRHTNITLNVEEKEILAKGPKFRIAESVNERTILELRTSFSRFAYQFRWREALKDRVNETNEGLVNYPIQNYISIPPSCSETDHKLQALALSFQQEISNASHHRKNHQRFNLNRRESLTIQCLRNKPL